MKKQKLKNPVTKDEFTEVLGNYLTKQDLKDELSNYPTKQDLKEELSNYPTKQDLKEELNQRFTSFHKTLNKEIGFKFEEMQIKLDEKFSKFSNLLLTAIDPLLKELETRREDREIATAQMEAVSSRLNDHDKRISKLEQS